MKKIVFGMNENLIGCNSDRYNYSETERDLYISEITKVVKNGAQLNAIKEAKSIEWASRFRTTSI